MSDDSDSESLPIIDEDDEMESSNESLDDDSVESDDQVEQDDEDDEDDDDGDDEELEDVDELDEDPSDQDDNDDDQDDNADEDCADELPEKESPKKKEKSIEDLDIKTVALERTIFVGNLPSKLDHRDVAKLFKSCGPVESARIRSVVPEKEKLSPKVALITKRIHPKVGSVNAYVVFAKTDNDDCITKALAMNGTVIDDHHIRVDRAQQPNSRRLTLASRKKSVFVGNLRFDLRDDDLINHFSKVGSVDYIRLVRDRATGLGKGFGFVKFMERASAKKALELNDTDFKGRKLRVKKVDEKMKTDDGGGGDKKPHKRYQKNVPKSDGQQEKKVQQAKTSAVGKKAKGRQTDRSIQFKANNPIRNNNQFTQQKPGPHGNLTNKPNLNQNKRTGKPADKKRVKFDLKRNTEKSDFQRRREGPQFKKVMISKKDKKPKKKTVMKKKLKKGQQ